MLVKDPGHLGVPLERLRVELHLGSRELEVVGEEHQALERIRKRQYQSLKLSITRPNLALEGKNSLQLSL